MERNVVGARELKTRLGAYLSRVRRGGTIVVTDRGVPIAEIRPLDPASGTAAVLAQLQARGEVTIGTGEPPPAFKAVGRRGPSLASAVSEDRDERL